MFVIGSLPWWIDNFVNQWAALAVYLPGDDGFESSLIERAVGLFLLGVPTLVGMRYTWLEYYLIPVGLVVLCLYLTAIYLLARSQNPLLKPGARPLVLGVPITLLLVFLASSFGTDPTGRYLLPLVLPFGIILGTFTEWLHTRTPKLIWTLPLILVFGYNLSAQAAAALKNDPGFTTQFANDLTHVSNQWDDELIAWLLENDLRHGYTNYWITYRLAFLSGEQIQFSPTLPYKEDLIASPGDNRYPAYDAATENAERIAYINWTNLPQLDDQLQLMFEQQRVSYTIHKIGPFTIYYDFEPQTPRFSFTKQ
jgi:hypothetical protein